MAGWPAMDIGKQISQVGVPSPTADGGVGRDGHWQAAKIGEVASRKSPGQISKSNVGHTRGRSLPQGFLPTANRHAAPSYAGPTYAEASTRFSVPRTPTPLRQKCVTNYHRGNAQQLYPEAKAANRPMRHRVSIDNP